VSFFPQQAQDNLKSERPKNKHSTVSNSISGRTLLTDLEPTKEDSGDLTEKLENIEKKIAHTQRRQQNSIEAIKQRVAATNSRLKERVERKKAEEEHEEHETIQKYYNNLKDQVAACKRRKKSLDFDLYSMKEQMQKRTQANLI
jgi:predicted  nucleic acid-binding Zn-ribbon protein